MNSIWFGDILGGKPYEFIGFGAMHATKPFEIVWFGDIHGPEPYEFIRFGPYEFMGFGVTDVTKPDGSMRGQTDQGIADHPTEARTIRARCSLAGSLLIGSTL